MSAQEFRQAQQQVLEHFGVEAQSRFVAVPGLEGGAHVLVAGQGPAVVMANGAQTPAAMWAPLMAQLGGFTLYAVDRPGCGLTGPLPVTTATVRPVAVRFLEQVLDALDLERPAFVANSMGSLWTAWLGLERPHRVAAAVHVATPAFILGTSAPLPMRLLSVPPLGRLLMKLQPPSIQRMDQVAARVHVELFREPEVRQVMVEGEKLPGYEAGFIGLLHACLRLRGARPPLVLTAEQLRQIGQPVQFIWADDDPFGSVEIGRRAAALVPDAEFHVVPGGHAPWVNHPQAVGRLAVPFLRRHAPAAGQPPAASRGPKRLIPGPAAVERAGAAVARWARRP